MRPVAVMLAAAAPLLAGAPALVSRQSPVDGGAGGTSDSRGAAVSADGRYVAFLSNADNLSADDDNGVRNAFVRDLQTGVTTFVSRRSAADGGAGADGSTTRVSISADGGRVAFQSTADNLSADDDDTLENIYVRDLATQTTTLVSRATDGAGADGHSTWPSISGDGTKVAFVSRANNLVEEHDEDLASIYVRDLTAGTTTIVSVTDGGAEADDGSDAPAISANGRRVAFVSRADNLSDSDDDRFPNVFVRDLAAGTTTLVSTGADGASLTPVSISRDGDRVAFAASAPGLSTEDDDGAVNVYVRDLPGARTVLASRATGGTPADGSSTKPAISGDGARVAFRSMADNLSAADDNDAINVFVRDLGRATTTLVGVGDAPAVSGDGRVVAYDSDAPGTGDGPWTDVFAATLVDPVVQLPDPPAPDPPAPATPQPPTGDPAAWNASAEPIPAASTPRTPARPVLLLPANRRCTSTATLRIAASAPAGRRVVRLRVSVAGRPARSATGPTLTLTRLPRGRFTLTASATLDDGASATASRTYRRCARLR